MTGREAQEVVRMVESNWRFDLGPARALWREELLPFDAELATKAVAKLARELHRRPDLSDLRDLLIRLTPALPQKSCSTCGGDLWVLVSTRPSLTPDSPYEEYAPCPDCNAYTNASFRRPDGSEFVPPDAARVREMLRR